jgi:hypothetical protein
MEGGGPALAAEVIGTSLEGAVLRSTHLAGTRLARVRRAGSVPVIGIVTAHRIDGAGVRDGFLSACGLAVPAAE